MQVDVFVQSSKISKLCFWSENRDIEFIYLFAFFLV